MSRALVLLAAAATLGGCVLFEAEPDLGVELTGPAVTRAASVTVRVRSEAPRDLALALDGEVVARGLRDGQEVPVATAALADGLHRLTLTASDGEHTFRSAATTLRIDRTPPVLVASSPVRGPRGEPFLAVATFDEPVAPDEAWLLLGGARVVATAEASADGLSVSVPVPLLSTQATVEVKVHDTAGNATVAGFGAWTPAVLLAEFTNLASGRIACCSLEIAARWRGAAPHLFVDEADLGEVPVLQFTGYWSEGVSPLDTRAFPDGLHRVSLRAAGALGADVSLTFDNTPPRLLSCGPRDGLPTDARIGAEIVARFSEEIVQDGRLYTVVALDTGARPPPPWIWTGTVPAVRDEAGNALAASTCTVEFPAWYASQWRVPAVEPLLPGGEFHLLRRDPSSATFARLGAGHPSPLDWVRVFLPSEPPDSTGLVQDVVLAPALSFTVGPGAFAWTSTQDGRTRIATSPGGGASVLLLPWEEPATVVGVAGVDALAWLQGSGAARTLRVYWIYPDALGVILDVGLPADAVLEGVALDPAARRIAFVERAAGGNALLYERDAPDRPAVLGPRQGPLNANPADSASEPALLSTADVELVVWVEGGQVRLRTRAPGGVFGAPVVMNALASQAARSPALAVSAAGPVLTFVEAHPGGDRLEARRLVAGVWASLPSLELGTSGGRVDVAWPGVFWRSASGDLELRTFNE